MVVTPTRRRILATLGALWIVVVLVFVLIQDGSGLGKLAFGVYGVVVFVSFVAWFLGRDRWERPLDRLRAVGSAVAILLVVIEFIWAWRT